VERRQAELLDRVATDCVRKLALLEEEHGRRLQVSEMVRRFQRDETDRVNVGRVETVYMDFENDKELLYDRVEADIREQVERLKREKLEADVSLALWMAGDAQRGKAKKKKPMKRRQVTVTGPYVVYSAREEDIDADWLAIRRATIEADISDRYDPS
uniref:Uncharacterized protein n=1 Tax=Plectus sambesii TaxID=2011161 RepID=A0A914XGU1_9BILA